MALVRRHIGRSIIMFWMVYGISCGGAIRCGRAASPASLLKWCLVSWEFYNSARCNWGLVRESTVKPVGKPDAGNSHVRFDERGWETGRRFAPVLAPILDSTGGSPEWSPLRIGSPCLRNLLGR